MALSDDTIVKLIAQLDADRKAYLSTFERIHETLSQALIAQSNGAALGHAITSRPLVQSPASSPLLASEQASDLPVLPHPIPRRTTTSSFVLERHHTHQLKDSIFTGDGSSDSEDDESFFAQETLPSRDFSEADLIEHLKTHPWDIYGKYILQDLLRNMSLLANGIFLKDRHHQTDANHQHADIYHVSTDGAPLRFRRGDSDEGPLATWEALKSTNCDQTKKPAVGRIIVVREPPSSLFAALHLTMEEHFDMDSIYRMLIDDHTPTKAITKGYLKHDPRRQRSIIFVFKYHTIIGEGRSPLTWQNHDDVDAPSEDHVPLSTCSSVVALSLAGRPSHTLRRNSRKRKSIVGHIYDPFAPWHVLSIQCFPDWFSSVDVHETNHHYVNGPDAFLASLLAEYKDAGKRFKQVLTTIQVLATPPNRSIFDAALRDELLFENDKYTYSRRYFWASQTLGLLSNEIKAMIAAYKETFTDEVWSGEHKTLFPGTRDQSARYDNWRRKLVYTRRQFEKEIAQLEDVLRMFQQQQKEIRGLREWLFSGTSVLESREAVSMAKITVEQGYNIRLLTLVTLFFLPPSLVTGVFGQTNMPVDDSFLPFALTLIGICTPTYLLILVFNYPDKVKAALASIAIFFTKLTSCALPEKSERMEKRIRDRRMPHPNPGRPLARSAATNASLEARLSHELNMESSLRGSEGFLHATTRRMSQSLSSHLPGAIRHASPGTALPHASIPSFQQEMDDLVRERKRSSTVKFEEPLYNPARSRVAESEEDAGERAMRWRTKESDGTTLQGLETPHANLSPVSPGASPTMLEANGTSAPPMTAVTLESIRESSVSPRAGAGGGSSLLQRFSDRWQLSPRTPSSGSRSPMEPV